MNIDDGHNESDFFSAYSWKVESDLGPAKPFIQSLLIWIYVRPPDLNYVGIAYRNVKDAYDMNRAVDFTNFNGDSRD